MIDDPALDQGGPLPSKKTEAVRPLPDRGRFGLRSAMVAVAAAAILARLAVAIGPAAALVMLAVLVLAGVAGVFALAVRGRGTRTEPMLWVVANAVERGLPLEPGIDACGELCGGATRQRARAVVRLLEQGVPMADAFTRIPGAVPKGGLVFLRLDWDGPRLGAALRDLIRRRSEWQPFRTTMAMRLAYLAWTLVVLQGVTGFILYFISPKFEAIFADFGVPLPAVTRWTIVAGAQPLLGPVLLGGIGLQLLALPVLATAFFDPLHWGIAPIDWLLMKRHGAIVLRALAGEVALGRPLPEALDRIARAYPGSAVRRRLIRARVRVERGRPWARSLAAVGLIRPADAEVLEAAERVGNLAWALGELADGLDRRFGYRLIALSQALYPVAVVALAVPVFLIAMAYFVPLVNLMEALVE